MNYYRLPILVLALCTAAVLSEAQTIPSCASKLTDCASYINSTNPPSTCCTPLKDAIEKELTCLCDLFNSPGLLTSLGINVTQALALPKNCNISGDLNACSNAPPPAVMTPPAVPGKDNGAARFASSGIFGFLLLWATIILC